MRSDEKEDFPGFGEMTNLYPERTGLPVLLWVYSPGRAGKEKIPAVRVQNVKGNRAANDAFTLSLEREPKILSGSCALGVEDFRRVIQFVKEHRSDFLAHWNQEIDEDELKARLYGGRPS